MHRRGFMKATLLTLPMPAAHAQPVPAPVVLELFTSQGCSSCPPADALLGELVRRPGVIGLAWHVDYWNGLGWRDPYARRAWTDRQRAYAACLHGEVFTPALVVNGAAMLAGSDREAVRRAVDQAAAPPVAVTLRRAASRMEVKIGATSAPVTALLVTYDPEQSTQIGAGENSGRRLVEYRVVRDAVMLDMPGTHMMLPPIPENRGAAILVQDKSWRVVGAAELLQNGGDGRADQSGQ
jgi:hypothetical protein